MLCLEPAGRRCVFRVRIAHPICCGLDVQKEESVSAWVIFPDNTGKEQYEIKVFGTFTDDLTRLREWLLALIMHLFQRKK